MYLQGELSIGSADVLVVCIGRETEQFIGVHFWIVRHEDCGRRCSNSEWRRSLFSRFLQRHPYEEHFHPSISKVTKAGEAWKRRHPMVGANVLPQVIVDAMLGKWDYCLRLFVLKGQSLKTASGYASRFSIVCEGYNIDPDSSFSVDRSLAPGARSLLGPLTDPALPLEERDDISHWPLILRAFNNWPSTLRQVLMLSFLR